LFEDLRYTDEHLVAGKMSIRVIDISQQIQISHNDGEWAVKTMGTTELTGNLLLEISMIEKPGLNIDLGLSLQRGHFQGAVNHIDWDQEEHQCILVICPDE
jgi:hypothetical protein